MDLFKKHISYRHDRPPGVWASQFQRDPTDLHTGYVTGLGSLTGRKPMSIMYKVPVADIVQVWEAQKANYLKDLEEALTTARELKEKGVEDSCVNGKIDSARTNAAMISLQLKYVDHEQDIYMQDHEMYGLFGAHRNLGPGDNPQVAAERRY
jgi:hypothetical protein